eukprot:365823-Chlamydomonas_euryale.AAC.14
MHASQVYSMRMRQSTRGTPLNGHGPNYHSIRSPRRPPRSQPCGHCAGPVTPAAVQVPGAVAAARRLPGGHCRAALEPAAAARDGRGALAGGALAHHWGLQPAVGACGGSRLQDRCQVFPA